METAHIQRLMEPDQEPNNIRSGKAPTQGQTSPLSETAARNLLHPPLPQNLEATNEGPQVEQQFTASIDDPIRRPGDSPIHIDTILTKVFYMII